MVEMGGEGCSSLLLRMVVFPDLCVVSTHTMVDRGGLVPTGQWFDSTPIFAGREEKRYLLLLGRDRSPGSHTVSTDTVEDGSSPSGRHEGPDSILRLS